MKNIIAVGLIILSLCSCQKEKAGDLMSPLHREKSQKNLSLPEAKQWATSRIDASLQQKLAIAWQQAKSVSTSDGNIIIVMLSGQPTVQQYKQGYRRLVLKRDRQTNQIEATIQEVIPDALYFQTKKRINSSDFTGRINEFDIALKFKKGSIYANGKQIGESRPATTIERTSYLKGGDNLRQLGGMEQGRTISAQSKVSLAMVVESCSWYQTSYVDSDGIFTVYSERMCSYSFYETGRSQDQSVGIEYSGGGGGGGGGGGQAPPTEPAPPPPSNLPAEDSPKVDPKKIIECFSLVKTEGAAFQVKILVIEPLPGTSFNVGPNSFGHVAIQLTKLNGSQSVTQTVGYYPTGSGLEKLVSPSQVKDNGDVSYHIESSYYADAAGFQEILDFVASPAPQYHFTDNNCARFAYLAARAGNLNVPDPTTSIGLSPASGAGSRAMTPAGMAAALRAQKAANPNIHNISEGGGRAPASKGECN